MSAQAAWAVAIDGMACSGSDHRQITIAGLKLILPRGEVRNRIGVLDRGRSIGGQDLAR